MRWSFEKIQISENGAIWRGSVKMQKYESCASAMPFWKNMKMAQMR
jgi:hypothetical protein